MLSLAGTSGPDPVARRRVRRAGARARPWLLPVAVVVAALVVPLRVTAPAPEAVVTPVPRAPSGRVLVAVTPSDPAVLALAVPGTAVVVYAAAPPGLDPDARGPARLVADAALVVDPVPGGPDAMAVGPLAPAGVLPAAPAGGAVTLAVTDAEAAALAAHPGGGLTLAVRAPTDPGGVAPDG
ncbi:hypothetical protein [Aquipuribacter sp. MA13-6]|uniref:hypothetical protein n=1 Tax=unclassified Aquipuribacter TaxID=2635084 RepID=UPI003EEE67A5